MRQDHYTNSEADAGRFEADHNAYEPDSDYEPEPQRTAPATPYHLTVSLETLMRSALAHPAAKTGYDREVRLTAPGVAAFVLVDGDDVEKMTALLSWMHLETKAVDGILYARRTDAPTLDPWAAQDHADKTAERTAHRQGDAA